MLNSTLQNQLEKLGLHLTYILQSDLDLSWCEISNISPHAYKWTSWAWIRYL